MIIKLKKCYNRNYILCLNPRARSCKMNDQGSKKLSFNKSTLFSLKAELLRKQEEVNDKKHLPKHKIENFKPPAAAKGKSQEKNVDNNFKRSFKDNLKAVDTEELEACRKAKLALEKKAELYEHLSDQAGNSQLAGRFLVDFDTKKKQEPPDEDREDQETTTDDTEKNYGNEGNEWTEFTDCLGRTRKCHISDLDMFIERDKKLIRVISNEKNGDSEASATTVKEKTLLVQKTNDYLQSLRDKWDQKEQELLAKDKDIHYQDVLFDEARIHGVGYYAFSTDEVERKKQMEELLKQREETLKAQQDAEQIRKKRDKMMAARVAAARARQRARAGLPPEEPKDPKQKDFTTCLLEFLTQQKNEADAKASVEERKKKEADEIERQKLRDVYVREWDIGKDGVEDKVKKFREMSQEEYVELQRSKRINEFAPIPRSSSNSPVGHVFDQSGRIFTPDDTPNTKTWADVRSNAITPPAPPKIGDIGNMSQSKSWADVRPQKTQSSAIIGEINEEQKGLYFSSKTNKDVNVKYRNFVKAQEPTPIINEIDDLDENYIREIGGNNLEIAPPPTYDYYGPVSKKAKFKKPFESDIREAYAQGTKSLETKSSNRKLPQHYDFTFD